MSATDKTKASSSYEKSALLDGNSILAGVSADCRNLIEKFKSRKSVRFDEFVSVWQEMKFSQIYRGRENLSELLEFTEGVLAVAKGFCLPPHPFLVKICGLYLLYGLYYKQLTKEDGVESVKIRVTEEEWDSFDALMQIVRRDEHYDVLFVFSKLIADGAFHFTATQWQYCLNKAYRQYLDKKNIYVHESNLIALKDCDFIKTLHDAYDRYISLKKTLTEMDSSVSVDTVNYSNPNFADHLISFLESAGSGRSISTNT